jgi:DNA-directed RNA polymerase specialized sigma24 family protein
VKALGPAVALTLVEAFREVGPLVEAGPGVAPDWALQVNARRSAAAECLHRKLRGLVRQLRFDRALLEEAAQEALLRLVARGPRGLREGDPQAEGQVTAYLRQALRHNALDLIGWATPERWTDALPADLPDPGPGLDSRTHDLLARELLVSAWNQLVDEIVPGIMAGMKSEESALRFAQSFATLSDLATGRVEPEEILQAEIRSGPRRKRRAGASGSGHKPRSERDAAQDRLDQRFKRALHDLQEGVVAYSVAHDLDKSRVKALEQVLGDLARRPGDRA